MDANAKAYSALNKPQYDMGCMFIRALNINRGDIVLDMGCGTGELTKFIADQVGLDGEVVGVDPDETRVKVGQEKFKDVNNVEFLVGSSVTGFPHDKEEYYDVHFSSAVFPWLKRDEKKLYVKKAYQCLKPGGRIAIQTTLMQDNLVPEAVKDLVDFLGEEECKQLLEDMGPFSNVETKITSHTHYFDSLEEYSTWLNASANKAIDLEERKEYLARNTVQEADGRLRYEIGGLVQITGTK